MHCKKFKNLFLNDIRQRAPDFCPYKTLLNWKRRKTRNGFS
jgi:hypothetical protein